MPEKSSNGRSETGFPHLAVPLSIDALMELNRPALTAMAQMNGKVYDGIAAMNKNWITFVNRRLKQDLSMPQQLAECKTVQDVYGVYTEFVQTAVADYQAGFEQIAKLSKTLAEDTVQAVQSGTEEVVRSTAEKVRSKAA